MKYGFLRAAAASPALRVADPAYNAARIIEVIAQQAKKGTELLVFPELSLSGYTCGDLFLQKTLTDGCLEALLQVAEATKDKKMLVFVGLPVVFAGKLYNCAAGIAGGKVLGLVPKVHLPNYNEFYEQRHFARGFEEEAYVRLPDGAIAHMSVNFLFSAQNFEELMVACEICEDVWVAGPPSTRHAQAGASVIVNLSASNEVIGKREYRKTLLAAQSGRNVCAYVYADAGMDESTSDMVFAGNSMIYENGALLAESAPFSGEVCEAELDIDFLLAERRRLNTFATRCERGPEGSYFSSDADFWTDALPSLRAVSPAPFVPAEEDERNERAALILNMQAHALAKRLAHTGAKTAVIGISGGLDSTLALLVTARAFDLLKKDRSDILGYTMPGFGTTGRTKGNSLSLMKAMGVTSRTVRITDAVLRHFKDIGHDPAVMDVAYENAQARYRTMILMDVANETGGLVVGTGDLSELALGWCTYNGDHMSMYAVNCGVPKTLVKHLVRAEGARLGGRVEKILEDILATEISPELLPPDAQGNIAQKTEDIVGPYELHDFYLYHVVRRGATPAKVYYLARRAFAGKYDGATLKKWLVAFYRRFFSQQFKRNCIPDGVKVGSVSLSPRADWRMPADASAALWLEEAQALTAEDEDEK